jgi:hypothetical protein
MTLTAITAPLSIREEIRISRKQLLASDRIVAGVLILAIITSIIVTVWTTIRLMPDGLPPYCFTLWHTYDYSDGLGYCSSLNRHALTWPPAFTGVVTAE